MIEVKLEDVLFTQALGRIIDQNRESFDRDQTMEAIKMVAKYASETLNATDKKEAVRDAYTIIDNFQDNIEPDTKRKLSCRKGCAFCCHVEVMITDLEKDVIMDYVQEHGIKYNAKRLEEQLAYDEKTLPRSEVSRCVFLGSDNACNIYPVRPLACRKYLVQNDPKFCNTKKYPQHETKVHFHYKTEILASAILTAAKKMGSMAQVILDKEIKNGVVKPLHEKTNGSY